MKLPQSNPKTYLYWCNTEAQDQRNPAPIFMLPQEAIEQFKKIYKKVFHKELSEAEATRLANYVLDFYKAVYLPVESENLMTTQNYESQNTN